MSKVFPAGTLMPFRMIVVQVFFWAMAVVASLKEHMPKEFV